LKGDYKYQGKVQRGKKRYSEILERGRNSTILWGKNASSPLRGETEGVDCPEGLIRRETRKSAIPSKIRFSTKTKGEKSCAHGNPRPVNSRSPPQGANPTYMGNGQAGKQTIRKEELREREERWGERRTWIGEEGGL